MLSFKEKNKQLTFITTFCLYVGIHMMRMSYSFNKSNIKKKFSFDGYFLGILDAFVYISLGIGFFLRYRLIKSANHTKILLQTSILIGIFFCVIPIISLLDLGITP
jgi:sugar phosphate permease